MTNQFGSWQICLRGVGAEFRSQVKIGFARKNFVQHFPEMLAKIADENFWEFFFRENFLDDENFHENENFRERQSLPLLL